MTVHDLDFLDHPERTAPRSAATTRRWPRSHARRADLVVVISEHTARQVGTALASRPRRMVSAARRAAAGGQSVHPPTPGPILFIGTIEPRKNLPMLFAAYERGGTPTPGCPAAPAGGRSVDQSAGILRRCARGAPAGRVEYRGYVSDDERQRCIGSVDARAAVARRGLRDDRRRGDAGRRAGDRLEPRRACPRSSGTPARSWIRPTQPASRRRSNGCSTDPPSGSAIAEAGRARRLFSWSDSARACWRRIAKAMARRRARTRECRVLRIGVDAREILGDATGVGRYLAELLRRWDARRTRIAAVRPVSPRPHRRSTPPGRSTIRVRRPRTARHLVGTDGAAARRRREPLDVFFAPAYTAPLGLPVPLALTIHDVSFLAHPEWFGRARACAAAG